MNTRPTCRVCGKPVPDDRRTLCSKYCKDEYNRRVNRAAYYRRKGRTPPPEKRKEAKPVRVKLPPGNWFKCIYDGPDNDSIPPFHTLSRAAVRDFVYHGARAEWFRAVG